MATPTTDSPGQYDTLLGLQPSFVFTGGLINNRSPMIPQSSGSESGVPPIDAVTGENSGAAQSPQSYGAQSAARPATNQPLFWAIALMVLGVFVLAHVAHLSTRG